MYTDDGDRQARNGIRSTDKDGHHRYGKCMTRAIHEDHSPDAIRAELAYLWARVHLLEERVDELARRNAQLNARRVDVREVADAGE